MRRSAVTVSSAFLACCVVTAVFAGLLLRVAVRAAAVIARDANATEMFYYEIRPELFNWTNDDVHAEFVYTPSLQNYPDLPSWIHYKFNNKNRCGYLYGTPPACSAAVVSSSSSSGRQIQLDIVGLNKKTYEVIGQVLQLNIFNKYEFAEYEIRFKINNLNVEDMFQEDRISYLLDIFKQNLWSDSKLNLYVTFLASASDLGQRLPLDPNDTEGVIVNLGSKSNFSSILYHLEKEISPLQKMNKCPKDFKRTSVERYFRANGFNLDWCSFKLVELTTVNQNDTIDIKDEISKTKEADENIWNLIEYQRYQSENTHTNTFNIALLILITVVSGVILSIGVFRWYTKKKLFL